MKRYLLFLLFVAALQCSGAQPAHLSFDRLDTQTGLPENLVIDILQDSQGYIWLTTQNGMVRYDGYNVKIYKPGSEDKSNLNYLFFKIVQDKNHDLWVCGANTGLFKYDRASDRFVQYKNKNATGHGYLALQGIDAGGKIWIASLKPDLSLAGLQQFDPAKGVFKTYNPDQISAHHLSFKYAVTYFDNQGQLWLETDNGFYRYNPSADSFNGYLTSADPLQQKAINMLYQPPSTPGKLWVGVQDKKEKHSYLLLMDMQSGQTEKFEHLQGDQNSLGSDTVHTAFEDSRRRLWLGTNAGISLYNAANHGFTNYQPVDTLKDSHKNLVSQIVADKNGLLWLATSSGVLGAAFGYGLLCFNPQTGVFKRYVHEQHDPTSLANNTITKLLFDRDGTLWLGLSFSGAAHVNPTKSAFTSLKATAGKFPWRGINYLAAAPDKTWWIGAGNGLYQYDRLSQIVKLIDKSPTGITYVSPGGLIYYQYGAGPLKLSLGIYDPKTGKTERYADNYKDITALRNNLVNCILQDHSGMVWIGTSGDGIHAFNPHTKTFKRYPFIYNDNTKVSHGMLDDKTVLSIFEDKAGTVWVGTNNGGVNHYDRDKDVFISSYKPAKGVNSVSAINQDKAGRLWAGSYLNGLFLLDDRTGAPLKRLTQKDGLLADQTEPNAIHKGAGDFIWVCTPRGFSRIKTRNLSIKNYPAVENNWTIIGTGMSQAADPEGNIMFWNADDIAIFNSSALTADADPPLVHIENMAYSDPRGAKDTSVTIQRYGQSKKELPWNQDKVTFNYVALHYVDAAENKYAYRLEGYDNHWVLAGAQQSVTYTNLAPGTYTFHVKAANSDGVWNNKGDSFILIINPPWWQTWWAWALWIILFVSAVYAFIAYRSRKLLRDKKVLEHKVLVRTEEVMQQKDEIVQQKEEIESQRDNLEKTLDDLKTTQSQLLQREKMASLGELTAGIAHEIQNPLNFVNNFSEVNTELIDEMDQEIAKGDLDEVKAIAANIKENQQKISQHGKRADFIVKGMLEHSRTNTGEKQLT
ncbi:MAG TPA: two-component regulator propeller domain-containing protein, partial [Mucilaginibacter sp.]|nr:two-component regulator propeller domain-containing protein [Mucilaginibacter sp.]